MLNKLILIALIIYLLAVLKVHSKSYCNIPKECKVIGITKRQLPTNQKRIKCGLNEGSKLRFNKSLIYNEESQNCQRVNKNETGELIIRPNKEKSLRLKKEMIDLANLIEYTRSFVFIKLSLIFEKFNGFEINLFDQIADYKIPNGNDNEINCMNCKYDFYLGDKLLKTCQDFQEAMNSTNSTNPRSIFQMFTQVYNNKIILYLSEKITNICPLVFKDFQVIKFRIYGENSFFSQRLLTFSSEKFIDLNSTIEIIEIFIENVDLDFKFLNPSVFNSVYKIVMWNKVNTIHPDLFHVLDNVTDIYLTLEYMRSVMHKNGIEWIKNINKGINCDLKNRSEVIDYVILNKIKFIHHDTENRPISPKLREVFPDEDFCIYQDFPINQLIVMFKNPDNKMESNNPRKDIGCVYLWITSSYEAFVDIYNVGTDQIIKSILESDEYKSISKCNFEEKRQRCNKSEFEFKPSHITTIFDIAGTMYTMKIVLNISSYVLVIFGLVSNILIIITISSKINEADFKEYKQYDYLRLNSICNCLILIIHMTTWLNDCIYPFQVFCPIIRKTIFMQYFKIIVQDVLMSTLRFMNSFTYIGFAFNRISLIGKDHNKLVKFMCEIGIKKFVGISLFISIGLSVIKFFQYDINYGTAIYSYPISYDFNISNPYSKNFNIVFFILNFISDMLNHLVLLLLNLAIDIGMIIKLRRTLNERFEKFKEYSTTAQQEKKKTENECVLDNATSMVILNTSLNIILKLPTSLFSLIYLWYCIYLQHNVPLNWENLYLERFFKRYFIDADLSGFLLKFSEFLYLLSISIQFFFYKHYDKKLNSAIKKKFGSKKNVQTGLFSFFNLINLITSPNNKKDKVENVN